MRRCPRTSGSSSLGFMQSDIHREVDMARRGQPAGNVLAALGLTVYTDALGRIGRQNGLLAADGDTSMEQQFNGFFNLLGAGYEPWRTRFKRRTAQSVYRAFRHGFAHRIHAEGSDHRRDARPSSRRDRHARGHLRLRHRGLSSAFRSSRSWPRKAAAGATRTQDSGGGPRTRVATISARSGKEVRTADESR